MTADPEVASPMAVRAVLVVDGDGDVVGSFATWDAAHGWAHLRAVQASSPVRVEDLAGRRTLEVWPDQCELTVWRADRRSPGRCGVGA